MKAEKRKKMSEKKMPEDFLQHGTNAMKAFRIMTEYYEKVEDEK